MSSNIATFKTLFEFASSEEVKFEGNAIWQKNEAYLHDPEKKYPTSTDIYTQEKIEPGFYALEVEVNIIKGKIGFRKKYTKATPEQLRSLGKPAVIAGGAA